MIELINLRRDGLNEAAMDTIQSVQINPSSLEKPGIFTKERLRELRKKGKDAAVSLIMATAIVTGGCTAKGRITLIDEMGPVSVYTNGRNASTGMDDKDFAAAQELARKMCPPEDKCVVIFTDDGVDGAGGFRTKKIEFYNKTDGEIIYSSGGASTTGTLQDTLKIAVPAAIAGGAIVGGAAVLRPPRSETNISQQGGDSSSHGGNTNVENSQGGQQTNVNNNTDVNVDQSQNQGQDQQQENNGRRRDNPCERAGSRMRDSSIFVAPPVGIRRR
jgi:hypothetical protein